MRATVRVDAYSARVPNDVPRHALSPDRSLESVIHAWVAGWSLSRGVEFAVERDDVFTVRLNADSRRVETVVVDPSRDVLEAVATDFAGQPDAWVTAIPSRRPEPIAGLTVLSDDELIMQLELAQRPAPDRQGLSLVRLDRPGIVFEVSYAVDGARAAEGQVAIWRGHAIFDRIRTDDAHRRQGFGGDVMAVLTNAALDSGARTGILAASVDGQRLYESLGWRETAPMTTYAISAA